jgi:hypothetical protein
VARLYRLFDLLLQSDLELPGVPTVSGGRPELVAQESKTLSHKTAGFVTYHEWRTAKDELAIEGLRRGREYVLRFPGAALFHFEQRSKNIGMQFEDHIDPVLRGHLLIDQVIPRVLHDQGRCMAHASAVRLASGPLLGFLGDSGSGKSTLAASLASQGASVLVDDCLELRSDEAGLLALPGYTSLRLWPDSLEHLGRLACGTFESSVCGAKNQLTPRNKVNPAKPERLDAVFLLSPLPRESQQIESRIDPANQAADGIAAISALFALEPADRATLQRNFEFLNQLFGGVCPVFRLSFPHDYGQISAVHRLIEHVVREVGMEAGQRESGSTS